MSCAENSRRWEALSQKSCSMMCRLGKQTFAAVQSAKGGLLRFEGIWGDSIAVASMCDDLFFSQALVGNLDGDAELACRYICPQTAPDMLDSVQKLIRFVALIPHVDDYLSFYERSDAWTTSTVCFFFSFSSQI